MNMKILKKMANKRGCKTKIINHRKGLILTGLSLKVTKAGKSEIINDISELDAFLKSI